MRHWVYFRFNLTMNVWRNWTPVCRMHPLYFVHWLMMMMKVAFSLKPQWLELEWEDDSFNSCKLSNCSEYTQERFIWFMINSCECAWSTTFCGEQPARIEVIPKGGQKIIVFVLNTRFVLANLSAHLDLYRVGYSTTAGHWSICSFSSVELSHPISYIIQGFSDVNAWRWNKMPVISHMDTSYCYYSNQAEYTHESKVIS